MGSYVKASRMAFALITGSLYWVFGVLEAIEALTPSATPLDVLHVHGDLMGAFVMAVIGQVLIEGGLELHRGMEDGVAYVYVGIVLGLMFAVIYLLVLISTAADTVLQGEGHDPIEGVRPGLYMGLLPLAGLLAWRRSFDIKGIRL